MNIKIKTIIVLKKIYQQEPQQNHHQSQNLPFYHQSQNKNTRDQLKVFKYEKQ